MGISRDIRIERDAAGIPTVTAHSRADLAYGTGFVHGQDRFFQMDLTRRRAAGELSEIVGPSTIEVDKRSRFHRFRSRARRVMGRMTAEEAELVSAYVGGVNAGLRDGDVVYNCLPNRSSISFSAYPPSPG